MSTPPAHLLVRKFLTPTRHRAYAVSAALAVTLLLFFGTSLPLSHSGKLGSLSGTVQQDQTRLGVPRILPPLGPAGVTIAPLEKLSNRARLAVPFGTWVNLTSTSGNAPLPRSSYAMAFDPALGVTVLFGGITTTNNPLGDTWFFESGHWINQSGTLSVSPAARWAAGLVYDPDLSGLLLFGGRNSYSPGSLFGDTWEFNASGWTLLHPSASPGAQLGRLLTYNEADGYAFLVVQPSPSGPQSYWRFQQGTWENITGGVTGSLPSIGIFAAYDAQEDAVLYYGGFSGSACVGGDTYTYSDRSFQNLTSSEISSPRAVMGSAVMTYDPASGGVVLFSGYDGHCTLTNETWLFQGGSWVNLTYALGAPPPGRWDARFAYDPTLGGDLTFGGNEEPQSGFNNFQNDTWLYRDALQANATANPPVDLLSSPVRLIGSAAGGVPPYTFAWTFGDGGTSSLQSPHHSYATPGNYTVTLRVTDSTSATVSSSVAVTVVSLLVTTVNGTPLSGAAPLTVTFHALATGGASPYRFNWTFGDGSPNSSVPNPVHTFTAIGTYTASLTVQDSSGQTNDSYIGISVTGPSPATPGIPWTDWILTGVLTGAVLVALAVLITLRKGRGRTSSQAEPPSTAHPPPPPSR